MDQPQLNPIIPLNEPSKTEEIGLPKSTLWNFIKDILSQNQVKGDKNIYQLIDKISIKYVNYISSLGCEICAKKGKKTLNIEHILEALKEMNFNNHIKLLTSEPYLQEMENEEKITEKEIKIDDHMNVKQMINKKKKKSNKRKRQFENEEDLEEMEREQRELFEKARIEQLNNLLPMKSVSDISQKFQDDKAQSMGEKDKVNDEYEKDMFKSNNQDEDEVNFD